MALILADVLGQSFGMIRDKSDMCQHSAKIPLAR